MIRGRKGLALAVRGPDGQIKTLVQPLPSLYTGPLREVPLGRGVIVLVETLALGVRALMDSANLALGEEKEEISPVALWGMLALAMVLGVVFFFLGPLFLMSWLGIPIPWVSNVLEGLLRLALFLLYLGAISFLPEVKRLFAYHGAEHKVINAYEAGVPLEVERIASFSTAHVRCGTAFLLVVLVLALVAFALVGKPAFWLQVLSRIALLPVLAAVGYEILRLSAAHGHRVWVRALLVPSLALQSLTTREPDQGQIEVALAALNAALRADGVLAEEVVQEEGESSSPVGS